MLRRELRVVDGAAVDARRRAGLEAAGAERQRAQALGEFVRRRIAGAAAGVVVEADVDAAAEERADREHHRARAEFDAGDGDDAAHRAVLDDEIAALLLEQREVRLVLERAADERLVELRDPPARASRAPPDPCWRSACATGWPPHRRRAP